MSVLFYAAQLFLLFSTAQCTYKVPDELKEVLNALHATCVTETGVSEVTDLVANAQAGIFKEDPALKCYMKCVLSTSGTLTDDGKIDVEALLAVSPADLVKKVDSILRTCGTQPGVDVCDAIYQTNLCWYNSVPEMYFLA